MEAKLEQIGDVFVCRLSGRMSYQSVDPFQQICLKNLVNRKVIFNLQGLSFVGSIGIGQFIDTMGELIKSPLGELKFCGVQTEFRRIFEVNEGVNRVEIFEDEHRAHLAFQGYAVPPLNAVFLSKLNQMHFIETEEEVSINLEEDLDSEGFDA
ncbi:MAG: STAS domain-containing protein [Bdellovibrionales bacterium]|nr:STAS domain-containing protein [Bdellovibrionales bacterium]